MRADRRSWRQAGIGTWLLAAVCAWALLLWLSALLGLGGRLPALPATDPGALPAAAPPAPARIGALAQYAEAARRPVFSEDRRPHAFVARADEADGGGDAAFDFRLTGVLISPQVRLAILQPAAGGESQRVRQGQAPEGAAGWTLVDVQPRRVVFEGGSGQMALELQPDARADAAATGTSDAATPRAAAAAADAAARAADAAADAVASPAPDEQRRIEEIRRRIEARRAQLRAPPKAGQPGRLRPLSGTDE